jgi:N-acetylglucosamine-6-sulfatase
VSRRLPICRSAVLACAVAAIALFVSAVVSERASAATQPSIVLILTDDQRWDTLAAMPTVGREIVARGVTFTNAFATNPRCCPSRASILTGRYSHGTGVYTVPGFAAFDDSSTVATWLQDRGYRTGLIGKYLVGYPGEFIPPGWDDWSAFSRGTNYYNYALWTNGAEELRGDRPVDYSTDVLANKATSFIRSTDVRTPLFLLYAPFAPHGRSGDRLQATPAPRHAGAFAEIEAWRPPAYNETDVSDKPSWIRNRGLFSTDLIARGDAFRESQLESLLAVDDAVGEIVAALEETGRLANTMIVFVSDNGHAWGEHRWFNKAVPYEESIRVPLVIRYDPLTSSGWKDGHIVANVDLAPTLAQLAGAQAPGAEGMSVLPLLERRGVAWRRDLLLENLGPPIPTYCGVRSNRYTYVQYRRGEEELYDLAVDRYQLQNRALDPLFRQAIVTFRSRLQTLCNPPPPDFRPRSPCLVSGTQSADVLAGTRYYDYICAYGGADRIYARAGDDNVSAGYGNDLVYGQDGRDVLDGGLSTDRLYGGPGADTIKAADGKQDIVGCGPGADVAFVDRFDRVDGCETERRR